MPTIAQQAIALAQSGRTAEGLALLETAPEDGDALLVRALWRIEGRAGPRDLANARALLGHAESHDHRGAARILGGLLAADGQWPAALALLDRWSGRDPIAARQQAAIAAMDLDENGAPRTLPTAASLSSDPVIRSIPGLLTATECAMLVELAAARFRPATIFHEGEGRFVHDPLRTGEAAAFPLVAEWPAVHALNRRLAAASGTAVAQGEPLQILRYGPGGEYRPHLDAVPGMANQRIATLLVALSDGFTGGETVFLELGLSWRGGVGDTLLFGNIDPAGRPDPRTRHAGTPVTAGTKLLASRWIRARPAGPDGFGAHEAGG